MRKGMTDNLEVRATLRYTTTRDFQRLLFADGLAVAFCAGCTREKKEASKLTDGVSNGRRQEWMDWFQGFDSIRQRQGWVSGIFNTRCNPQPSSGQ